MLPRNRQKPSMVRPSFAFTTLHGGMVVLDASIEQSCQSEDAALADVAFVVF